MDDKLKLEKSESEFGEMNSLQDVQNIFIAISLPSVPKEYCDELEKNYDFWAEA